jgi:hypothetical protein
MMWEQVGQTLNESTVRVVSRIASLLPGLVALVIAILVAAAIAWVVAMVLRRVLRAVNFDERLENWGFQAMAEWSPAHSPTLLAARLAWWAIVLAGFVLGLAAFDATLTSQLAFNIFAYVPRLVVSILVVLVGALVARYLSRHVLLEAVNMNLQYARVLSAGVRWMIMTLAITMALDHLQIAVGIVHLAFGILFGGIVLALSLAVGLGSKELVSRSLEREKEKAYQETEEPFHHL